MTRLSSTVGAARSARIPRLIAVFASSWRTRESGGALGEGSSASRRWSKATAPPADALTATTQTSTEPTNTATATTLLRQVGPAFDNDHNHRGARNMAASALNPLTI